MYTGFLHLHSFLAYAVLIILIVATINSILGMSSDRKFKDSDRKIALFGLIFTHIQLLGGIVLYFVSQKGLSMLTSGNAMGNSEMRLTALEHPLINIIAVVLITIGFSKHKKAASDKAKFKSIGIMYALGTILILSRIPWNSWF